MVSFNCYHCSKTFKKKQIDFHGCKPIRVSCITCRKQFGPEYKNHTSCLTQEQLYFGPYAKTKSNKQTNSETQVKKVQEVEEARWKGWRNEIQALVKSAEGQIQVQTVRKVLASKAKEQKICSEEQDIDSIFMKKLKSCKGIFRVVRTSSVIQQWDDGSFLKSFNRKQFLTDRQRPQI